MAVILKLDRVMFENGNMKVPELSELSGLNKNTLYSFYKGEIKRVDLDTIDKLCNALNCSIGDLLEHVSEDGTKI